DHIDGRNSDQHQQAIELMFGSVQLSRHKTQNYTVAAVREASMDKEKIGQALAHLRRADPVMRDVIRRAGPFRLKLRRDRFHALVSSILSQQISGKAAASIRARLEEYVAPERISPESLGRLTPRQLRAIGVSPQKAAYLLDLAERVGSGGLRLNRLARMADEQVIEALIQVKGIGVWTAQMFLIFSLGRLDVSLMRTSGCVWPFAISTAWRIFRIRRRAIVLRCPGAHTPVSRVGIAGDRWNLKTDKKSKKGRANRPSRLAVSPHRQVRDRRITFLPAASAQPHQNGLPQRLTAAVLHWVAITLPTTVNRGMDVKFHIKR